MKMTLKTFLDRGFVKKLGYGKFVSLADFDTEFDISLLSNLWTTLNAAKKFVPNVQDVQITSCLRTLAKAGGSATSGHLSGWALDLQPISGRGHTIDTLFNAILKKCDDTRLLPDQLERARSWIHIGFSNKASSSFGRGQVYRWSKSKPNVTFDESVAGINGRAASWYAKFDPFQYKKELTSLETLLSPGKTTGSSFLDSLSALDESSTPDIM